MERAIKRSDNTVQTFKCKILKSYISSNGYLSVSLSKDGKTRMFNVHSLLMLSFVDKNYTKNKLVVNHKDGDKLNNNFSNLEIVTSSQNNQHAILNNLNNPRKRKNTKFDEIMLKQIMLDIENKNFILLKDLCDKYNISYSYLNQLKNGERGVINHQNNY
jgi:predicted O-linked N-acetylglucosamine transferase (SPINDLY family)